jgi:HAD superfamily hydrolase (TIGR01484 family)
MRYHALACDYDGTLARDGHVDQPTMDALERLLATGRKLILVTGRELDELLEIFPGVTLFERVVAENGGLLYQPSTREEKLLGEAPSEAFVRALRERGVGPLSVGRIIVATWHPHETVVLQTIRDMGLELQVIFNKGAVMILPASINKATGLLAALKDVGLSAHEAVGVGDAENDHAFLTLCECSAAVANALPAVKERADLVTQADHGAGVTELINGLIENDLDGADAKLHRHHLLLGTRSNGQEVCLPSYGPNVLIAGPSGSGKSTAATSLLERLADLRYQYCIIDPEGDYDNLDGAIHVGSAQRGPTIDEILHLLADPKHRLVVNLVGMSMTDRPPFFTALLPRLREFRARTARPHWLIVDEAHHLLPASWEPGCAAFPPDLKQTLLITVHPDQVAASVLASVGTVLAVGETPKKTLSNFCQALHETPPKVPTTKLAAGEVLLWRRGTGEAAYRVQIAPCRTERRRHTRKYAEGELPCECCFYFRGPSGKLNLRAQNLFLFLQLAEGVDEETWLHHLRQHDYSRWFHERIKNDTLANETAAIESRDGISADESRRLIRQAIERQYTLPASIHLRPGSVAETQGVVP